ncbi:poly(A)-specific ribonuclease PARN-like [Ptychodera flava]|uniref:poly(A)-specific ribonuclease PARN-like n=1 Tax=Ptychodera flava TaxID=63121 RepID=UPI003969E134
MDVTRSNFKECLQMVTSLIKESSFLAIDGEFTGLNTAINLHAFDTPQERYGKLLKGSLDFLLIQFGLCVFTYESEKSRYIAHPFNFYIFPTPLNRHAPDKRFLCQSSSLDFLISHGFDFNKLFKEGIPYLAPHDEQNMRELLHQKHSMADDDSNTHLASPSIISPTPRPTMIAIPEDQKNFIDNISQKIEDFLKDNERETLQLEPCNAFLRKLIYQTVKSKFPTGIFVDTRTGEKKERYMVITKVSEDDVKKKEEERKQADFDELDEAVGFAKIIRLISESGKLVVGHNMLLDILHIIHQFSHPLPEDLDDFKSMVRCVFPKLLDTKLMASSQPFKELICHTALGDLHKTLEGKPFSKPNIEMSSKCQNYNSGKEQLHEAGYDALITGSCFVTMANYIGTFQDPVKSRIPPSSPLLHPFTNKIFVMKMQDIPYINLTGQDLQPGRNHVFHLTFPKEWKASDLYHLFTPFGPVYIAWIDDTSALVSLNHREHADTVLKALSQADSYHIQTYYQFKNIKTGSSSQGKKRQHKEVDITYPGDVKRQKILDVNAPPFVSRRSVSPIREDPEKESAEIEAEDGSAQKKQNSDKEAKASTSTEEEKLFEEPATW